MGEMMRYVGTAIATMVLLCCAGGAGEFTNVTVRKGLTQVAYGAAKTACATELQGELAITTSTGERSVVEMTAEGEEVWLGGEKMGDTWTWTGGERGDPIPFYTMACIFGECFWEGGRPSGPGDRVALLPGGMWRASAQNVERAYVCEIEYRVTYECIATATGTIYDNVHNNCLAQNGYLAAVPSVEAWEAIKRTGGCGALETVRIGGDDYAPNAFEVSNFEPDEFGFFKWRGGVLGMERGGKGRLVSSGPSPNTVLYGFRTLSYLPGQPTLGRRQHTLEVVMPQEQLNDYNWQVGTDPVRAYICEFPVVVEPEPEPEPGEPEVSGPVNCFGQGREVTVSDTRSVSDCVMNGVVVTVSETGTLRMSSVNANDSTINVDGGAGANGGLDISRAALGNTVVVLRGEFSGGRGVSVSGTNIDVSEIVDVEQGESLGVWMHLISVKLMGGSNVSVTQNAIRHAVNGDAAVMYSSGDLELDGGTVRMGSNTVRVRSSGGRADVIRADGVVTVGGGSEVSMVRNTASVTGTTGGCIVCMVSAVVMPTGQLRIDSQTGSISAMNGTLLGVRESIANQGVVTILRNTVEYGDSAPRFVDAAVSLPDGGSRLVLTENIMTANSGVPLPEYEISGPVSGNGAMALGCTLFFGRLLLTFSELLLIVPEYANTVEERCTNEFVATPAPTDGSSVGESVTPSGPSTVSLLAIIIGSVLGFIALVLVAMAVFTLWWRRR